MRTGRGGDIEVAILRDAFEASGLSAPALARRLGWTRTQIRRTKRVDGSHSRPYTVSWADGTRVTRLMQRQSCELSVGIAIAEALGINVPCPPADRKSCSKCHRELSLDEFTPEKNGKLGRKAHCRDCANAMARARRRANLMAHRAYGVICAARRRSAECGVDLLAARAWCEILRSDPCAYCGSRLPIAIDHIDPVSRDGKTAVENLSAACQRCNTSKSDKSLILALAEGVMR